MSFRQQATRFARELLQKMPRNERRMWESARTLQELGELMACWLEGKIMSRPGYNLGQPCTPDPETGPLIDVLAGLCRLGYVTSDSQPGVTTDYTQEALLIGFAPPEIVGDMFRLFRNTPEVAVAACPVLELPGSWPWRLDDTELRYEDAELMWSGDGLSEEGWDAVQDSWVLRVSEPEPNERGLMWSMLAGYIMRKRQGLVVPS